MSRATADDQLRFLLSCVKHSNNGKIDFVEVAKECRIVSKGAAAKRYERLMKANGIHPSCEKPAPTSLPKEKSKAAIAKAAVAKRRKIEGDSYDTREDDEDEDMKPMILKDEPADHHHPQIKPEPETDFQGFTYPHIPISPSPSYFSHPNQSMMHSPGFYHIPSPMQSPVHQNYQNLSMVPPVHQQFRQYQIPTPLPVRSQFPVSQMESTRPLFSRSGNGRAGQSSSFVAEFCNEDFATGLDNLKTVSTPMPATRSEAQEEASRPLSVITPPLITMPLSPQEVVLQANELSPKDGAHSRQISAGLPLNASLGIGLTAGQGIENSILITD